MMTLFTSRDQQRGCSLDTPLLDCTAHSVRVPQGADTTPILINFWRPLAHLRHHFLPNLSRRQ